jgi:hypothetical protein
VCPLPRFINANIASLTPGLNIYDQGQAYTEREHREWLKEAGFADFERKILPDGFSMVRGRKPN